MKKISRHSIISQSLIKDDLLSLVKYSWQSFLVTSVIIGLLLFFLNILIGVANNANNFTRAIEARLGMYIYLVDDMDQSERYTRLLALQKDLDAAWLVSRYISQSEAQATLAQIIPDVIERFRQYNISDPLPATLHIKLRRHEDYQKMYQIVLQYRELIRNLDEVANGEQTLRAQERRVSQSLNFISLIRNGAIFLITLFVCIIIIILIYLLRILFAKFRDIIEIKKLLGSSYTQIALPFLLASMIILIAGFGVMAIAMGGLDYFFHIQQIPPLMFNVDNFSLPIIPETWFASWNVWLMLAAQAIVICGWVFLWAHYFLLKAVKKAGE